MTLLPLSAAGRWIYCHASPALEAPFPNDPSPDAMDGTAAAWVAEQILKGNFSAEELIERKADNGVIITGDMVDHVKMYVDHVRSIATRLNGLVVEGSIQAGFGGIGKPDAAYFTEQSWLHLWDLKYGYFPVEVYENWQLLTESIAIYEQYYGKITGATIHIVQPRQYHVDGRIRSRDLSLEEIEHYRGIAYTAAEKTRSPDAMACTGAWCRNCTAVAVCPAARRASAAAVEVAYKGLPEELPPEAIGQELRILNAAKRALQQRLDGIAASAMSTIKSGGIVPGWDVGHALGDRRFKSDADRKALEVMTGVSLTDEKGVTPKEAERRGVPEALIELFVERPSTGLKLVPCDASRKLDEMFGGGA